MRMYGLQSLHLRYFDEEWLTGSWCKRYVVLMTRKNKAGYKGQKYEYLYVSHAFILKFEKLKHIRFNCHRYCL